MKTYLFVVVLPFVDDLDGVLLFVILGTFVDADSLFADPVLTGTAQQRPEFVVLGDGRSATTHEQRPFLGALSHLLQGLLVVRGALFE